MFEGAGIDSLMLGGYKTENTMVSERIDSYRCPDCSAP